MLVLGPKQREWVRIGGIRVAWYLDERGHYRLLIDAPPHVDVQREFAKKKPAVRAEPRAQGEA